MSNNPSSSDRADAVAAEPRNVTYEVWTLRSGAVEPQAAITEIPTIHEAFALLNEHGGPTLFEVRDSAGSIHPLFREPDVISPNSSIPIQTIQASDQVTEVQKEPSKSNRNELITITDSIIFLAIITIISMISGYVTVGIVILLSTGITMLIRNMRKEHNSHA